jgi:thioredoxin-dependent peroxiredoxin
MRLSGAVAQNGQRALRPALIRYTLNPSTPAPATFAGIGAPRHRALTTKFQEAGSKLELERKPVPPLLGGCISMPKKDERKAMATLKEGDVAPDFTLQRDGGGSVKLSDFRGKPVVLYFYPKDDTSGCTAQAIGFSQSAGEFKAAGAEILGISPDSVKSHDKFRDKHGLSIILGSDEGKEAINAYGVWAEKKMYGKAYMGVERSTFLIGKDGKLVRIWRGVKVPGHVEEVLEAVKSL